MSSASAPSRLATANLIGLLAAAVFIRWLVLPVPGHDGDVRVVADWAERLAEGGPWNFYRHGFSIYPALLYLYWPVGVALDGRELYFAIKGLSVLFDLAVGVVLYRIGRSRAGELVGLACAALYLFNPAVILAGPIWGQIDAAGTLIFLLALLATDARRFALAGGLAVLAGLTKPQFGLVLLPVLVVALADADRWRLGWRVAVGGLAAGLAVVVPLRLWPGQYLDMLGYTATSKPFASVNAFNPWALAFGMDHPDGGLVWIGTALLLVGLVASLVPLRRRRDLVALLVVGTFLSFSFYFLPTRVHERYLFPATALLVPLVFSAGAAAYRGRFVAYLALSLAFAAGLVWALLDTTSFSLPPPLPELWLSGPAFWLIGLTLIGSAAWWVWVLWREVNSPPAEALRGTRCISR